MTAVSEDLERGEETEGGEVEVEFLWITEYFMILKGGNHDSLRPGG